MLIGEQIYREITLDQHVKCLIHSDRPIMS